VRGISAANWVISKLDAFATATENPITTREIYLLKQSVDFFNESNRRQFEEVNRKIVYLIRATIEKEKEEGAECVEARPGLFIPSQWKQNYLEIYESELPWLLSHCLQNAMLRDPTLGETKNWESPKPPSKFRGTGTEPQDTKEIQQGFSPSQVEFVSLISRIRIYLLTISQLFHSLELVIVAAGRNSLVTEESILLSSRVDLLNILCAFSEFDDDVSAAWYLFALDEEIHDTESDHREALRAKTRFGTSRAISKSLLIKDGLVDPDYCTKPSKIYFELVAQFDLLCKKLGLEPLATRWYAASSLSLALEIEQCSVFATRPRSPSPRIFDYASLLSRLIDEIDGFDPDVESPSEFMRELGMVRLVETDPSDLKRILEIEQIIDDSDYRDAWFDRFKSECDDLMASTISGTEFENDEPSPVAGDSLGTANPRSLSSRLAELKDLFDRGLISEAQFDEKRSKLIDEL